MAIVCSVERVPSRQSSNRMTRPTDAPMERLAHIRSRLRWRCSTPDASLHGQRLIGFPDRGGDQGWASTSCRIRSKRSPRSYAVKHVLPSTSFMPLVITLEASHPGPPARRGLRCPRSDPGAGEKRMTACGRTAAPRARLAPVPTVPSAHGSMAHAGLTYAAVRIRRPSWPW